MPHSYKKFFLPFILEDKSDFIRGGVVTPGLCDPELEAAGDVHLVIKG
jgi:hypothetical protein